MTCQCAAGSWKARIDCALADFRDAGRIARVVNVGRDVFEHYISETMTHQRGSFTPTNGGYCYKDVRLNYVPEFEVGAIEVK